MDLDFSRTQSMLGRSCLGLLGHSYVNTSDLGSSLAFNWAL